MKAIVGGVLILAMLAAGTAFAYVVDDSDWCWQLRSEARERAMEARQAAREARETAREQIFEAKHEAARARLEALREATRARIDFARERRDILREQMRARREILRDVQRELRRDRVLLTSFVHTSPFRPRSCSPLSRPGCRLPESSGYLWKAL